MIEILEAIMRHNPTDQSIADAETATVQEYKFKHRAYMEFLKQKAKIAWIKAGDENTKLFHQSIRSRKIQN